MPYLLKFLLVHMLIAINVKHFESNMKSCLRFWNHNAVKWSKAMDTGYNEEKN